VTSDSAIHSEVTAVF